MIIDIFNYGEVGSKDHFFGIAYEHIQQSLSLRLHALLLHLSR
jgi:hypothetical protein